MPPALTQVSAIARSHSAAMPSAVRVSRRSRAKTAAISLELISPGIYDDTRRLVSSTSIRM
jgi:hypothetical protein